MIYIHIPFCKSFCTYCGFYSEKSVCYEAFAKALRREICLRKDEIGAADEIKTLYFGGGTPSVLPLPLFKDILNALAGAESSPSGEEEGTLLDFPAGGLTQLLNLEEFTVEMNPEDVVTGGPEYAETLLRLGVTRASLGVQSFDEGILHWMNRRHSAETAVKAYRLLESAGFDNISIDLIFGLPRVGRGDASAPQERSSLPEGKSFAECGRSDGERGGFTPLLTREKWDETIDRALNISANGRPPRHISAYQLSVEEDSALEKMTQRGQCAEEDGEECAAQYDLLCSRLAAAGYRHYEISNFALPGFEARHNSAYWTRAPYVGLGPGAHSLRRLPEGGFGRSWNAPDLQGYIAALCGPKREAARTGDGSEGGSVISRGGLALPGGSEILTPEQIGIENVMLGLRTERGCSLADLKDACSPEKLNAEIASGHLVPAPQESAYYRIPEKYFFISDNIIKELLS